MPYCFILFSRTPADDGYSPPVPRHPETFPEAAYKKEVLSSQTGYVSKIHTEEIGRISLLLGGGRETKESAIDLSVGLILQKKYGSYVKEGECLAVLHANNLEKLEQAEERLRNAYIIQADPVEERAVIKNVIL